MGKWDSPNIAILMMVALQPPHFLIAVYSHVSPKWRRWISGLVWFGIYTELMGYITQVEESGWLCAHEVQANLIPEALQPFDPTLEFIEGRISPLEIWEPQKATKPVL